MNVTIESSGSVVIAYLIGEIDHHTAGEVREKIDDTLMFVKPKTLILDFKNVSFMDSSGIGLVMGRYRLLQSINPACQIEIKNVTLQTKKIMELAGLSSIAKIKENENEFKLTIDSKSVNEAFARVAVSAFVTPLDPTLEEIADLKTAVSEAVTNCIVHAYKDTYGKIFISGKLFDDNTVKIVIRDKGCGIVDVSQAMTPLFTTGEGDRAGLGFTVMESFCDKINVKSKLTFGTTVTLSKKIEGKSKW